LQIKRTTPKEHLEHQIPLLPKYRILFRHCLRHDYTLSKTMNFLFLNSSRSKWGGGNEKSILLATKALTAHKTVLAYRNDQVGEHFNIPKYKLPFLNEADLTTIAKLIAIVKKHQIDVIIPSMRKDYALAGMVSRICRIKNILWLGTTLDLKNKWVYNLVFNMMADGIIVNAEKIRKTLLLSHFMRPDKIKVIYYGLDPEAIERQVKEKKIPKPFSFMVTAMGRVEPNKGFDFLIRSFARFLMLTHAPDAGIVIIGQGPQLEEYKKLAKTLGIANHILFTGFIANPFPYLSQSDVFTLTSIIEGLSIALLEAMFLAVAPVSTYAGGVEEVISDGKNGFLLHYGDEEKLAALLAMLYQNPELKTEIAKKARNTVTPMFSLDKLQDEIVSFCQTTGSKQQNTGV
jgi:glycosyltransferase involved in cell wall biosynthesis